MADDSDLRHRALSAHVAQELGGPARAIAGYLELVVEQARELGLSGILADLDKVDGASADLSRLLDTMIRVGLDADGVTGAEFEAKLRHDLRTPLNAIIGYSEMIDEDLSELPHAALREDIRVILTEAGELLDLIDTIVAFSRTGKTEAAAGAARQADLVARGLQRSVDISRPLSAAVDPGRILIIDDVASNRDLLRRRLEREGHDLVMAQSGAEGLQHLAEREFDLVLLDILMPDINGIEVLMRMKSDPRLRRIPVIMISGLTEMDAVVRCIEAGADDYLTKPLNPVLLGARINSSLEKKRWIDREQRYLKHIEFEKERADTLLRAILPDRVVERLNNGELVIADRVDDVTVLFADLVGFTSVAARTSPAKLVQRLDGIFSAFDTLAEHHGVEKIKTIGDAYMAVAGLMEPGGNHARRTVDLARAMLVELRRVDRHETPFRIRVGIHSGPVVAGLIGQRRFVYDVWGETVNIASRLESQGVADRIQISATTRDAIGDGVALEPRGMLDLKGAGRVETFFVGI
jgi:class 3 adenylate cyclase